MKKILLLGKDGQVGWEARRTLSCLGEVVALDYPEVDFTNPDQLMARVLEEKPQVIFNAAAYTNVEQAEVEQEKARMVNAISVGMLAEAALKLDALLIHFSTDYVFDGTKGSPYTEEDLPKPLNAYGMTKLQGEQAIQQVNCKHFILRTAWVYSMRRDSFILKVLNWAKNRSAIRVVVDQVGNPTWARDLAQASSCLVAGYTEGHRSSETNYRGIYHLAGAGYANRMEWARAILNHRSPDQPPVDVLPGLSSDFPTLANRPAYSVLDCSLFTKVFGLWLPPWQQSLSLAMSQE